MAAKPLSIQKVAKTFGGSDASSQPVTARIQNLAGNFGSHQALLAPAGFLALSRVLLAGVVSVVRRREHDPLRVGSCSSSRGVDTRSGADRRGCAGVGRPHSRTGPGAARGIEPFPDHVPAADFGGRAPAALGVSPSCAAGQRAATHCAGRGGAWAFGCG